jgi:hypothetical protein
MNVSLRPLEDRDLDTIYQQVTDPESVRMAAFTAEDQTDRRAFLNRMRLRADASVSGRNRVLTPHTDDAENLEVDRPDNLNTGSRAGCRNLRSTCKSAISLVANRVLRPPQVVPPAGG